MKLSASASVFPSRPTIRSGSCDGEVLNTARPSGEKPGMDSDDATRSTSAVERASASARPASSRNASRDLRQSPVIEPPSMAVPGRGSATSWRVPISSYTWTPSGSVLTTGLDRARTVRSTRPFSFMIRSRASARVPSVTARLTMPWISFQSTGWKWERAPDAVREAGSAGRPRSRAASASRVTRPVASSQRQMPVAIAARTSSVRIVTLYEHL